jgi:membrane fusion protein (multidrug efflux system)
MKKANIIYHLIKRLYNMHKKNEQLTVTLPVETDSDFSIKSFSQLCLFVSRYFLHTYKFFIPVYRTSIKSYNQIILLIVVGCGLSILQSCGSSEKPATESKPVDDVPATEVVLLQKGKLSSTLQLPGELTAFQQVDLYAKVNSFVKKLYADVGSEVKKGQLLATMEAPEIGSQVAGAQSKLRSVEALYIATKANYQRLLETSKTPGTISPNDLDMALAKQKSDYAQVQAAQAAYREVTNTREYLQIRAPFNGIISARNISAGAYVGPSGKGSELPMFTLQEQGNLRLSVAVPEAYTGFLNTRSEVSFKVKSMPNQTFTARVKRMSGTLDTRLRSERIEMDVVNASKRLLPGMIAEITIPLPSGDSTFIIPKSALGNSTERLFVIKITDKKAQWIDVKKGREADGKTEIYGKLAVGDTIVTTANEEVRDGSDISKVKVKAVEL